MQLPVYTHPSLTVLIDDSDSFLASLQFQLDPMLASMTFHDTNSALHWLRQGAPGPASALQVNFDTHAPLAEQCNVAVDLECIPRISAQAGRFALPSVLVVDYSMPQMNGIAFCEAVRALPCKKILFTGAADEKIAVNAFNRGLIDRYIKKSEANALDQLELEIRALQRQYFTEQSDTLGDLLMLHDYHFLGDAALAATVAELSRRHGFVEHYLFPDPAGILFYDKHGKGTLMIIATGQSLHAQYEVARDSEAPPSLLAALLERRVIPFFSAPGGDAMYSREVGDGWYRYCAAPQLCAGKETYYWALFDLPPHYAAWPVLPYAQYLRELRAGLRPRAACAAAVA